MIEGPWFSGFVTHEAVDFGRRNVIAGMHTIGIRLRAYVIAILFFVLVVRWKIPAEDKVEGVFTTKDKSC